MEFVKSLFSPDSIVGDLGLIGVILIIFAETGLLVGIAFPGDSLLFAAGVAASAVGDNLLGGAALSPVPLFIGTALAAIIGSQLGYFFGAKYGSKLFDRPDGIFFTRARVASTEKWLLKYGVGKAVFISRFTPFARTLINPIIGTIGYPAKKFFFWNLISGLVWTQGIVGLGYFLGNRADGEVNGYLLPLVGAALWLTLVPVAIEFFREVRQKRAQKRGELES
jgi:membrane-associated protein